jgi:hypothetical protein
MFQLSDSKLCAVADGNTGIKYTNDRGRNAHKKCHTILSDTDTKQWTFRYGHLLG